MTLNSAADISNMKISTNLAKFVVRKSTEPRFECDRRERVESKLWIAKEPLPLCRYRLSCGSLNRCTTNEGEDDQPKNKTENVYNCYQNNRSAQFSTNHFKYLIILIYLVLYGLMKFQKFKIVFSNYSFLIAEMLRFSD